MVKLYDPFLCNCTKLNSCYVSVVVVHGVSKTVLIFNFRVSKAKPVHQAQEV